MYMEVLEHEVEALNEEVTRLRQMVHRITKFSEPPLGEGAAIIYRDGIEVPYRQSAPAQTPTPTSALLNDYAPQPMSCTTTVKERRNSSRTLQTQIEGCTLKLLSMLSALHENYSSNPDLDTEKIIKSHHKDPKRLKRRMNKHAPPRRHGEHSLSLSSDPYSSSSSCLAASKPRPSLDVSKNVPHAVRHDTKDRAAPLGPVVEPSPLPLPPSNAVVELSASPMTEPVTRAPAAPKPTRIPSPGAATQADHARTDCDASSRTAPAPLNASGPRHVINAREGRVVAQQEGASPLPKPDQSLSLSSKAGALGLATETERSRPANSMHLLQHLSQTSESSSTEQAASRPPIVSGALEDSKPVLPNPAIAVAELSEDSTSEDDLDALKGAFGVRSDPPGQGRRSSEKGMKFGTTTSTGIHAQQLRPSVLEFIRRQGGDTSTSLSELTDEVSVRAREGQAQDRGGAIPPQLVQTQLREANSCAAAERNNTGSHTPVLENSLNPSRSSLQFSGYGQIGISANSLPGDYDFGFESLNHSPRLESPSLPSIPRTRWSPGTENKGS
ncbi:unnamed protein product [Phytomonas sp. Hart1]|nr:unnamed protein product [Phytomonas sp. Hart1]|eukprot:CCW69991.1 unnamed protein product [Phytomonas sp. isolate Hart1]